MTHNQPPEYPPPPPETDEPYDDMVQRKLDALSPAEWKAVLEHQRRKWEQQRRKK